MSHQIECEEAIKEFGQTMLLFSETENRFSFQEKNLADLSSEIWQVLGKATNLASKLWTLGLNELAEQMESCKQLLSRMHFDLSTEMNESNLTEREKSE